MKATYFEKVRYRLPELKHFPGLTGNQKELITTIYFLDKGDRRACWSSMESLANMTAMTVGQVRGHLHRMRHIVHTIGTIGGRQACRRIKLPESYQLRPDFRGSMITETVNGQVRRRPRKVKEANPAVIYTPDPAIFCAREVCSDTAHPDVPQKSIEEKIPHNPLAEARGDQTSFSSQTDRVGKGATTTESASRRDWVTAFHQLEFSQRLLTHFSMTDISPALARKVVKRYRNGTLTAANLDLVLKHLPRLQTAPATLDAFCKQFLHLKDTVIRSRRATITRTLETQLRAITPDVKSRAQFELFQSNFRYGDTLWCEVANRTMRGERIPVTAALMWSCLQQGDFPEQFGAGWTRLLTDYTAEEFQRARGLIAAKLQRVIPVWEKADVDELLEWDEAPYGAVAIIDDWLEGERNAAAAAAEAAA